MCSIVYSSVGTYSFRSVSYTHLDVYKRQETNHIMIDIVCDEGWYIYPVPIFELADRNFNVWWDEFNGSLKRTNYGIKFIHTNLSGQADALKITLQGGYSQKADLEYAWPYWGKDRSWRFTSNVFYSRNKEAYYNTINNKLVFHKALAEDEYSLNRFRINTCLLYTSRCV